MLPPVMGPFNISWHEIVNLRWVCFFSRQLNAFCHKSFTTSLFEDASYRWWLIVSVVQPFHATIFSGAFENWRENQLTLKALLLQRRHRSFKIQSVGYFRLYQKHRCWYRETFVSKIINSEIRPTPNGPYSFCQNIRIKPRKSWFFFRQILPLKPLFRSISKNF